MVLIINDIVSRAANAPEAEGSGFKPRCFELGGCITYSAICSTLIKW